MFTYLLTKRAGGIASSTDLIGDVYAEWSPGFWLQHAACQQLNLPYNPAD